MKPILRLFACMSMAVTPSVILAAEKIDASSSGPDSVATKVNYESFHIRDGLINCRMKFEKEKAGRVVFMGGSITAARFPKNAWHFAVREYLQKKFPQTEFDFIQTGMDGQGTTPHAFRFVRDAMKNGPVDLLFIEGAVNDGRQLAIKGYTATNALRGMEGVVRQARTLNPDIDIVMLHFVDSWATLYSRGKTPPSIEAHEKVAEYYGIPSNEMAKEILARERAGEFVWATAFNGVHPNEFGSTILDQSILRFLDMAMQVPLPTGREIRPGRLPTIPLDEKSYYQAELMDISSATLGAGWQLLSDWKPGADYKGVTQRGFVNVPALVADKPGAELRLKFDGRAVGVWAATGPDSGCFEYSIDGGTPMVYDPWGDWCASGYFACPVVFSADLQPGPHELVLKVAKESPAASKGSALQIMHFFVNH